MSDRLFQQPAVRDVAKESNNATASGCTAVKYWARVGGGASKGAADAPVRESGSGHSEVRNAAAAVDHDSKGPEKARECWSCSKSGSQLQGLPCYFCKSTHHRQVCESPGVFAAQSLTCGGPGLTACRHRRRLCHRKTQDKKPAYVVCMN